MFFLRPKQEAFEPPEPPLTSWMFGDLKSCKDIDWKTRKWLTATCRDKHGKFQEPSTVKYKNCLVHGDNKIWVKNQGGKLQCSK